MKRLLITGASGLLGLSTALEAVKEFDVFGVAHQQPIQATAFKMITADLTAPDAVEQLYDQIRPDWVIHCAALTNLEACEENPELAEQLNVKLPARMASQAARTDARFIHISTDAVFDGHKGDYSEADQPNPLSVYAKTKLEGELSVAAAYSQSAIARVNLFGWSHNGKRSLAEFFYYNLAAGKPIKGFTDVYFCPLLVNDLASILFDMLDDNLSGLFHVFSSDTISKYDFGVAIADRFGLDSSLISPISVKDSGLSAARSPNLVMNTQKLSNALAKPLPSITDGLDRFHDQYKQEYPTKLAAMIPAIV